MKIYIRASHTLIDNCKLKAISTKSECLCLSALPSNFHFFSLYHFSCVSYSPLCLGGPPPTSPGLQPPLPPPSPTRYRSNGFLLALSCSGYLSFSPFLSSISTFLNTLVLAIYYHTGKRTLGCKVSWLLLAVSLSHKDLKIYQKWNTSACVCKFGCVDLNMPSANLLHLFFFFSRLMLPFNSTTNYLTLLTSLVQLRVPRFSTKRTTYSSHFPGRIPKKGPSIEFVQDYRLFSQASRI